MKKLALGALLLGLAVACGGGKVALLDAGVDAPPACNPVMKTGCMANEKCTWIVDIDQTPTADEIGHIGCVPDGTIADGLACDNARMATNGGADMCVSGELCISRKCKPICDPQLVDGAAPGACPLNFACSTYAGVFVSTGDPVAGVCEPGCDPRSLWLDRCGQAQRHLHQQPWLPVIPLRTNGIDRYGREPVHIHRSRPPVLGRERQPLR
jgi:hypothetical protein